ncbi:unnamed protein product [Calypogeia fissa]
MSMENATLRDLTRKRLANAFSEVLNEAEGEYLSKAKATDVGQVAVSVESAMFSKLGPFYVLGGSKYDSIMFNLQDVNNPDLRRRVLIGEISAQELLTMSAEDRESDKRKLLEIQGIKGEALFECEG